MPEHPRSAPRRPGSTGDAGQRRALVVEDDPSIADLIRMYLQRDGFRVQVESDGKAGLSAARSLSPDVLILDIRLPRLSGLEICRQLRADGSDVPVLFVSARDEEIDRVVGLELGADDYVTKPFSPRELMARVAAVLRRGGARGTGEQPARELTSAAVKLDPDGRRCWSNGAEVQLTATEFALLEALMGRPGRVFSRDELLTTVWGYSNATTRTVDVHVAQLRAKLGQDNPIRTVRGVGYGIDR